MKQTIDHSDCLVNYFGDCIHTVQEEPKRMRIQLREPCPTCENVMGTIDAAGETECVNGHQISKPMPERSDDDYDSPYA